MLRRTIMSVAMDPASKKAKLGVPTLYHKLYWSSQPIVHLLNELGVKDVTIVKVDEKEIKMDWYKEMNPLGKIPVFVDSDGSVICESGAIATYLLDKYDKDHKLLPASGIERYQQLDVIHFCVTQLYPPLATLFIAQTEGEKEAALKEANGRLLENVEHLLKRSGDKKFLFGDEITIADMFLVYELMGFFFNPKGGMRTKLTEQYVNDVTALASTKEAYENFPQE